MARHPSAKPAAQTTVEFAMLASVLFLLIVGIFDFGRAIAVYISIAEAAHEGARQLVLRSNETPASDVAVINATLAKIGGGGIILLKDPCLVMQTTPCPTPTPPPNIGYIWLTENRGAGNHEVTVLITYTWAPIEGLITQIVGTQIVMASSSSMRAEY